ncbi:hypothetical protein DUI87_02811 [Hirundo rustica rustica]|uniref:Integrase catalytic domain-containing protein n=1 Tax=Hirundo rustica rustica TaxID=333673 RepID=A0A3M0LG82_HIRRU|nr:hypothetical protein DUI87_02811 [Hirundo rustica rustica]
MDSISQVIRDCETCAAIKQAKRVKPLWYGGRWSKYKYGEAWQIDYITLPQTRQGKHYVLTMVEATTGWLETYPVPHTTACNTILGLEKQVLWMHDTPERIESDNGTCFKNSLITSWAREHGIEWVYHIPYHAPASGRVERYNGLLKTTLKALGGGSFRNWEQHLAKATWLVNTRGSTNREDPAQSEPLHTVDGEKVPVVHVREPFVTFVERLTSAIKLQVKKEGAQEQVLEEMALANANKQCTVAILSLSMELAPTLDDMLQHAICFNVVIARVAVAPGINMDVNTVLAWDQNLGSFMSVQSNSCPFLNMGPVTKVTVAVIHFAIWVNEVRKSWIFNFLWKAGTWIQGYHTLTVCFWGYFNSGTYCKEMTPGEIFSQPFTQLFGPTPPVFEGSKSLNVNDIIQWLVLLVCLFCLAFRDKGRLTWITTLIPTLENKGTAPQLEPIPQPDPAPQPEPIPQPDTVPQPASGINHPDWVKEIREMGQMLREYLSPVVASLAPAARKPSPCPDKGESDGAAAEPTDVTTVQVPAEPQGQPQPAAVAPVETKKYKVEKANWQRRGKPIWAADEWKDIATRVEKLPVKVRHVDAHVPKSRANEEHQNNEQVIHDCETCAAIKQAKRVKPLWCGGQWSKYKYGEAWQIDYITLPQTRQGKRYVLTMVEATTGWLETYPVPHATARNTILGLEKQIL